jgi:hypothetical protein
MKMDQCTCLKGKNFPYILEPSPILNDNGKNSLYLNIQWLLTMKDEKNVCFIFLPLKINTHPLIDKYHSQHTN